MNKPLDPKALKYDRDIKYVETEISIGFIKDCIEEKLRQFNHITDDYDLVEFSFGPIPKPWAKDSRTKINGYLNLKMPLHYALRKKQPETSEVKHRIYE